MRSLACLLKFLSPCNIKTIKVFNTSSELIFLIYLICDVVFKPYTINHLISNAYHSLHIQNGCALIDVLLCSNGTSCKLEIKCPLKLLDMVFDIAIHGCDLHQLGGIYLAQPLNVHWSSIFIHSMMPVGIILQDFLEFLEFKILQ